MMDEPGDLVASIRQLVLGFAPHIRDARSDEEVQNAYLRMEEIDKNFHRYTFVKCLRSAIEDAIGKSIDAEIDRHAVDHNSPMADQENIVRSITSKVINLPAYVGLSKQIQNTLVQTCDNILTSSDREFFLGEPLTLTDSSTGREFIPHDHLNKSEVLFSDAESSIGDSSLNHSMVIFMNTTQQHDVADGLRRMNSIEVRRNAIRDLLRVTGFDVQNCDVWPLIRDGLRDALLDTDEVLWMQTLRFLARGLSTNSACSRDIYVTLVGFVKEQLTSPNFQMPQVADGLSFAPLHIRKIITEFRLINSFQQMVPSYWQRYPEGCLEEILEPTLSLIDGDVYTPMSGRFTPMHFLSLVDCNALWFIRSMHGQFSRAHLLRVLEKHTSIVANAVRSCLHYASVVTQSSLNTFLHDGNTTLRSSITRQLVYSGAEAEFAYFAHSLCILGRLILYEHGRKFFPVKFDDDEEPVTLTRLLVTLLQMVIHISRHRPLDILTVSDNTSAALDPCMLVMDTVRRLCSTENVCQRTMCKDLIGDVLMSPFREWLDGCSDSGGRNMPPRDAVLSTVTDILCAVATTQCGQQLLLYGDNSRNWRSTSEVTSTAPVNLLVKFVQQALKVDDDAFRLRVIGGLLFVCRQLYGTCEGLLVVNRHNLHCSVATAWKSADHAASAITPTPATTNREKLAIIQWEELLRSNLLTFAETPKGVLLLQQTGVMLECVAYMHLRYMSKREKFGYGHMMSQVAATASGIVAFRETGFSRTLVEGLWNVLEMLDASTCIPKCWPLGPIDKQVKKPFIRVVSLLSSFRPVYEMIPDHQPGTVKLETASSGLHQSPTTVADLLDRLVFIDSMAKMQALFNYEQSHAYGLRLLSVLTSCLNTFLLLQAKYSFQEMLLESQAKNVAGDGSEIILDMLSLERNYILVKTYLIGGPSERVLPPRTLMTGKSELFAYPLFSAYPVPNEYLPALSRQNETDNESGLARFVGKSKKTDIQPSWLSTARKLLPVELAVAGNAVNCGLVMELLEQAIEVYCKMPDDAVFPTVSHLISDSSLNKLSLSSFQKCGISLAVRYGHHLQLLSQSQKDSEDQLCQLLKRCSVFLHQQQISPDDAAGATPLQDCISTKADVGFDWFTATVFLMTSGNTDRAMKFLAKFSSLLGSAYLWTQRIHRSVLLPKSYILSGIPPIHFVTCHSVELILQLELPQVCSAFRMSGCSPAQICQQWLDQCFWNYLDWPQVCHYIVVCVVLGVDYQVYVCVAILRHLQRRLMKQMQDKNLLVFLKEEPIQGFSFDEQNFGYMHKLEKKFRDLVLADMRSILAKP